MIKSRSLFKCDNLIVLSEIRDECIDLIYLDPPYNTGRVHSTKSAEFSDIWKYGDVDDDVLTRLQNRDSRLFGLVRQSGSIHGNSMKCYISMICTRLIEMYRVLKSTGSIYLHCDPISSHYIKLAMDILFGSDNFRNEIVWCYSTGGASDNWFARKHDVILFYTKSDEYCFNTPRVPYTSGMSKQKTHAHKFHKDGKIMLDWWDDISTVNPKSKQRVDYPTQKPLELLDRIIKTSTDKEGTVLDPFCGSGTTCIAAERLGRNWIGIDISRDALDIAKDRFNNEIGMFMNIDITEIQT